MIFTRTGAIALAALIATGGLALVTSPTQAASTCKGLERGACERNGSCSWVDDHTRKDGVKVSGYCRSKPGRSGTEKSSKDKKK